MTKHRVTMLDEMTDAERKRVRVMSLFEYFPDAMIEVALVIAEGQNQHGTAEWDKSKSNDHHGSLLRHMLQAGTLDKDGRRHSGKVAWRAFAALQMEIEADRQAAAKRARNRAHKPLCKAGRNCRVCAAQRRKRS